MWSQFRALAARIGLAAEQVAVVERGGEEALVPDPVQSEIQYKVRPDPDWTQRVLQAFEGTLVNSRRESAGIIPIDDGQLVIAELSSPEHAVTAQVTAGQYELFLTIAHLGAEETHDYEEHVSHAFALLRDDRSVAVIEPLTDEDGTELGVDASTIAFAGAGVVQQIAAGYPHNRIWTTYDLVRSESPDADVSGRKSVRAVNDDGSGALIAFNAGYGREDYPLFKLADSDGNIVGVLMDCFVDNRPYEIRG